MMIRWERVLLVASILTVVSAGVRATGDRLVYEQQSVQHEQRVAEADGTWCFLLDSRGTPQRFYGAEACGLKP